MDNIERVVVKLTSDFSHLFANIEKYAMYLNAKISQQTASGLYIEPVSDGLLYIYKNLEVCQLLNQPYKPFFLNKNSVSTDADNHPSSQEDFFLSNVVDSNSFPQIGISIFFEAESKPQEQIISIFDRFVRAITDKHFIIKTVNPAKIQVHFETFGALKAYSDAVQSLFTSHL